MVGACLERKYNEFWFERQKLTKYHRIIGGRAQVYLPHKKMLSIGAAALAFNAPLLPAASTAARSSATLMQQTADKSQAIPFLKTPPALDG